MVVSLGPGKFYGTSLPRPRIYTDVKFNSERVDPPVPVIDPLMAWAIEAHWSMGGLSFQRLRLQGKIEGNVNKLRAEREKFFKKQNRSGTAASGSHLSGSEGKGVAGNKRPASVTPPPAPAAKKRRRYMALIDDDDDEKEDDQESAEEEEVKTQNRGVRRRLVKKLGDEFDRVASENEISDASDLGNKGKKMGSPMKGYGSADASESMATRTRSRRSEKSDDADVVMSVVRVVLKSNSKGKKTKAENSKNEGGKSPVAVNGVRTSPRLAKRASN